MRKKPFNGSMGFVGLLMVLLFAVMLASCSPSTGPYRDYYVDPYGEDRAGRGTEAEPWRTIQYALDQAEYSDARTTRINLNRGIYTEDLEITESVVLQGVGRGPVAVVTGSLRPLAEVSAIYRSRGDDSPGHRIAGSIDVEIYDLNIHYGKLAIDGARVRMSRVDVVEVAGLFGVDVNSSPSFVMDDVRVATIPYRDDGTRRAQLADLGVRATDSIIEIRNSWFGDVFDHPIDLKGLTFATIEDNEIEGSFIHNADGIRVTGDVTADILSNEILRLTPDIEPGTDNPQWPHAGIAFGGDYGHSGRPLVHVEGNTIAGFDVGIGITTSAQRILAQNNDISGIRYAVAASDRYDHASWWRSPPVVDFGDGYLGSVGGNTFRNQGDFGIWMDGSYSLDACDNEWEVPPDQVPDRIHDLYDDPTLGKVYWEDCTRPRAADDRAREVTGEDEAGGSSAPLVELPTATHTAEPSTLPLVVVDSLCWRGPGPLYEVVSSLAAGTEVQILGRGVEGDWWVLDNPRYPGVRCWAPGDDIEVEPNYDFPNTLFEIPPLPTATPQPGCLWYDQQQNEVCYPIDQCPVDFEASLGACVP